MNTAADKATTIKLTDLQRQALYDYSRTGQAPRDSMERTLQAKGALGRDPIHHKNTWNVTYAITEAGQAALDAYYTPERVASMAAAARQARRDADAAAAAEHARLDAAVARRADAQQKLQAILGDATPWWLNREVTAHSDRSGVNGGQSYGSVTAEELLAIVQAAISNTRPTAG